MSDLCTGKDTWPPGCCLCFIHGERFSLKDRVMVDSLEPSAEMDISVDMASPSSVGMHQGQWRMQTPTGLYFGGKACSLVKQNRFSG